MELGSRPLLGTRGDQALFVGRSGELAALERTVRRGLNTLVEGPRGSGKTSLLRRLDYIFRAAETPTPRLVYVRAAGLTRPADVLTRVVEVVEGREPAGAIAAPGATLRALSEARRDRPLTVLLDDVEAEAGHAVFGVLRDELWETGVTWVVAATPEVAARLLVPPADAFFETVLRIRPLSRAEMRELLRRRVPDISPPLLDAISNSASQPREALEIARAAAVTAGDGTSADLPAGDVTAALAEWQTALSRLSRPAAALAAELGSLGAVAASDPHLLERMGWTRPRAIQVLDELDKAGLVDVTFSRGPGRGRPRKVYRLRSATEFAARRGAATP